MHISDVLRTKGSEVVTVAPDTPVRACLGLLAGRRIGALVLSADGRTLDGLVSERDIVLALAALGGPYVLDGPVSAIAAPRMHTTTPDAPIEEVMRLMTAERARHVPVVVDGALVGLVSLGDVVRHRLDELESDQQHLVAYISSGG
jgi:CBS domain-containing protein